VTVDGRGGANDGNVGNTSNQTSGITGLVTVNDTGGSTVLTLNDQGDATGRSVTVGTGFVSGLTTVPIAYTFFSAPSRIVVNGGTGGNTYILGAAPALPVTLNAGAAVSPAVNTVLVPIYSATVAVNDQAQDDVIISNSGHLAGITAPVTLSGTARRTSPSTATPTVPPRRSPSPPPR
jgi:hypothetical protein